MAARTPEQIAAEQAKLEQQLAPMQKNLDSQTVNEKKWEATHPKEAAERRRLIQQDKDDYDSNVAYEQRKQMIHELQKPKQSNCMRPIGSGPNGLIMGMGPCD
ncbi:hypothetical protein WM40_22000 [Robbsia andropogonis]|uniref:Uncharacterized protein n=2 Tax=Robbsia andropogonis TaxID=28092 RepID=A0A0F5JWP2_9BURK|nr:hypothetical protein WM40_22000 [Robbsia andropogonis]